MICGSHDEADLIENHFQVTPSSKKSEQTSLCRSGWLLKCQREGGLRNAALHPGSCVTLVLLKPETEKERKRSSNPPEVQISRTLLLCGFPF